MHLQNQENKGLVALYFASFFWGSAFIAQKILVDAGIPPFFMVALRMLFSLFLIGFIVKLPVSIQTIKKSAIMGFILLLVFNLQTMGLKYLDSSVSSFITSLNLVLLPFVNFLFYRTKILIPNIISIFIALIGVYFFNVSDTFQFMINIGMILTLLCAISCAVQLVVGNQFIKDENPLQMSIFQNLFCGLYSIILAFVVERDTITTITWNTYSYISIAYLGIIASSLCFFLLSVGQRYVKDVVKVGLIMSLQPIFTMVIAVPLLGERITYFKLIGMVCIMLAIIIDECIGHKRRKTNKTITE